MCQFKIAPAPAAPGTARQRQTDSGGGCDGGGGCGCTCSSGGSTAAAEAAAAAAAAAEELRRGPAQLLARYFSTCQQEAAESMDGPHHCSSSRYSPAMAAELVASYKKADSGSNNKPKDNNNNNYDNNNNNNSSNSNSTTNCSSDKSSAKATAQSRRRVQFADELGGSLIQIRRFESEPRVEEKQQVVEEVVGMEQFTVRLLCHFEHPTAERALRALSGAACNIQLSGLRLDAAGAGGVSVSGCALVNSASYRKRVFVRVTADRWRSFADHEAEFAGSLDDRRDAFEFGIGCGGGEEAELEFCVCFEAEGRCRDWDSNGGCNYRISLVLPRLATFGIGGDECDDEDADE